MDANNVADAIVSSVKKSNLNFYLQESPVSVNINIRKTFVKNKDGHTLQPPPNDTAGVTIEEKLEIEKLKKEKSDLSIKLEKAKADKLTANKKAARLQEENEALKKKNEEIQVNIDTLKSVKNTASKNIKSKDKEIASLEVENKNLEEDFKKIKTENINLKEKLELKDDENRKILDNNVKLEEKMKSLLDILYGCHECGLCECECGDSVTEDCATSLEPSFPPAALSETPESQHPPRTSSGSSSWSPPPTPPCDTCGGVNFGPCPSNICFGCIPPLQSKPEPDTSSPSRTPPGTPPLLRLKHTATRTRPEEPGII